MTSKGIWYERHDDGELHVVGDPAFAQEILNRGTSSSTIDWRAIADSGGYEVDVLPIVHEDQAPDPFTQAAERYGRPDLGDQPNI